MRRLWLLISALLAPCYGFVQAPALNSLRPLRASAGSARGMSLASGFVSCAERRGFEPAASFAHRVQAGNALPRGLPRLLAPVDSFEGRDGIEVRLDMPGVNKEDILLQFDDELNLLTVDALRLPLALPGMAVRTQERQMGRIGRWVALTKPVDANRIQASLENGVLVVTLRKKTL